VLDRTGSAVGHGNLRRRWRRFKRPVEGSKRGGKISGGLASATLYETHCARAVFDGPGRIAHGEKRVLAETTGLTVGTQPV
jgi:hypothetical protein